jgi:hypothetical protein
MDAAMMTRLFTLLEQVPSVDRLVRIIDSMRVIGGLGLCFLEYTLSSKMHVLKQP